jgi:hypothetical protein
MSCLIYCYAECRYAECRGVIPAAGVSLIALTALNLYTKVRLKRLATNNNIVLLLAAKKIYNIDPQFY